MTVREALLWGEKKLKANGAGDWAKADAAFLLGHILQKSSPNILLFQEEALSVEEKMVYIKGLGRMSRHEPLQYVTGIQNFYGLDFIVDERVLIPRYDTEILCEQALSSIDQGAKYILDLCTGSGALAVVLCVLRPQITCMATDISQDALMVAVRNAQKHEVLEKIEFVQSDLLQNVQGAFDLIVCNPPYITTQEMDALSDEVKKEPRLALHGGDDGLAYYRRILCEVRGHLKPNGHLLMEIGYTQAQEVRQLFEENGFRNIEIKQDFEHRDRVVCGRL